MCVGGAGGKVDADHSIVQGADEYSGNHVECSVGGR